MKLVKSLMLSLSFVMPVFISTNSFASASSKEFVSGAAEISAKSPFAVNKNNTDVILSNNITQPQHTRAIQSALLSEYRQWKGTHYRWGGSTHQGIDCSALMQHLFSASLNRNLPRTTFEQIKDGERINKHDLKAGDLVFFKTSARIRHVGVYVGNNKFIHASTSEGVTISSLDNSYWATRYETARRLDLMS